MSSGLLLSESPVGWSEPGRTRRPVCWSSKRIPFRHSRCPVVLLSRQPSSGLDPDPASFECLFHPQHEIILLLVHIFRSKCDHVIKSLYIIERKFSKVHQSRKSTDSGVRRCRFEPCFCCLLDVGHWSGHTPSPGLRLLLREFRELGSRLSLVSFKPEVLRAGTSQLHSNLLLELGIPPFLSYQSAFKRGLLFWIYQMKFFLSVPDEMKIISSPLFRRTPPNLGFPCFSDYLNFFGSAAALFLCMSLSYHQSLTIKSCILKVLSLCWPTSLWLQTLCPEAGRVPFYPTPVSFTGSACSRSLLLKPPKDFFSFLRDSLFG